MKSFSRLSVFLVFGLLVQTNDGISQEVGPGGVGVDSGLELWFDASQLGMTDGDAVSTWSDMSGNGNDASQSTPALQPVYHTGGTLNGWAYVQFDGSASEIQTGSIGALGTDLVTYFAVYRNTRSFTTNGQTNNILLTSTSKNAVTWGFHHKRESATSYKNVFFNRKADATSVVYSTSLFSNLNNTTGQVVGCEWNSSDQLRGKTYGANFSVGTSAGINSFSHNFTKIANTFQGEFYELLIYPNVLNSAKQKIVQNYLASKYGLTLSTDNYYAYGNTYFNDVAGIGSDGIGAEHLSSRGTGIIAISASSLSSGVYFMWGHDGGGTSPTTSNLPSTYTGTNGVRMNQIWRVSESGAGTGNITVKFDMTGIQFGDPNEYQLVVDSDGDFTDGNETLFNGTFDGDTIIFTLNGGDISDSDYFTLCSEQKTIYSIVDGQNWNDATTWSCNCIPNNTNNVNIQDGHSVTVNTTTNSVDTLSIESTGEIIFDNGSSFEILGDVACSGSFSVITGSTISLNGSKVQTLDFSGVVTFDTLTVSNSGGGVTMNSGTFSFSGVLFPDLGEIDFNSNPVTFLSSASGTAAIGPISGTITNLSNVTSQRFISGGVAGYREVGFPFQASYSLSDWDDEIYISGPGFPDGCASSTSVPCFTSAKYWDGSNLKGITDIDSTINSGFGIDIYLGDNLNTYSGGVLSTSKALNLSSSVILTINSGWNFIANPFLAPVDFDNVIRGSGVQNYFYIYDSSTDGWQWWDGASASIANLNGGLISAYQGIWVYNTGGVSTLTFDQSSKSVTSSDAFLRQMDANPISLMTVAIRKSNHSSCSSKLYLNVSKSEGNSMPKLPNIHDEINVFASYEGQNYNRLSLPLNDNCSKVEIGLDGIEEGNYSLYFDHVPDNLNVILMDNVTGGRVQVTDQSSFDYYLADADADRFELWFVEKGGEYSDCDNSISDNTDLSYGITSSGITIGGFEVKDELNLSFEIIDLAGKLVYRENGVVNYGNDYYINKNLSSGVYVIRVTNDDGNMLDAGKIIVN